MSVVLRGSNKEMYQREVEELGCTRYEPCPICYKCKVKSSHQFLKCQRCTIPMCRHSDKDRNFMIRRENFAITVDGEVEQAFRDMLDHAEEMGWCTCGEQAK